MSRWLTSRPAPAPCQLESIEELDEFVRLEAEAGATPRGAETAGGEAASGAASGEAGEAMPVPEAWSDPSAVLTPRALSPLKEARMHRLVVLTPRGDDLDHDLDDLGGDLEGDLAGGDGAETGDDASRGGRASPWASPRLSQGAAHGQEAD